MSRKKPKASRAESRMEVRCTNSDKANFQRAADKEGYSTLTDWVVVNLRRRAAEVLGSTH